MGTTHVRIDDELYERLKAHKRDDESFSETIERLTSDYTLVDFAAETEPIGMTNEEIEATTSLAPPTLRDADDDS
jgi:predicted CopG family antitoxin